MFAIPSHSPSELRNLFVDVQNPSPGELLAAGYRVHPGKQCGHPANELFRDPRPGPRSLRPRKALLSSVLYEHGIPDQRSELLLEHYIVPADEATDAPASFPQFTQLPFEIREHIWRLALPSRVLDVREVRHKSQYLSVRGAVLPVPPIARVCREARDVVMRLGRYLNLAWTSYPYEEDTQIETSPAGLFLGGKDIVLREPDTSTFFDPPCADQAPETDSSAVSLSTNGILSNMKCDSVALNWHPPHRKPNERRLPGSIPLYPWSTIRRLPPNIRTVYICFRSRFVDINLCVAPEFFVATEQQGYGGIEAQLVVDLYNDQRLAELVSLDNLQADGLRTEPRFAAPDIRNPGLCLNCDRVQWETYMKPLVVSHWLQLFEDELDEHSYPDVFPGDAPLGYNPDHPWVKEKFERIPNFQPAVIVHLQVQKEMDSEEWDYNTRVVTLR